MKPYISTFIALPIVQIQNRQRRMHMITTRTMLMPGSSVIRQSSRCNVRSKIIFSDYKPRCWESHLTSPSGYTSTYAGIDTSYMPISSKPTKHSIRLGGKSIKKLDLRRHMATGNDPLTLSLLTNKLYMFTGKRGRTELPDCNPFVIAIVKKF